MDGSSGNAKIEIHFGNVLTIDAYGLNDPFNGEIQLDGILDITVADGGWEMAGRLEVDSAISSVIRGSQMRVTGEMEMVFGDLGIESSVIFSPGSVVTLGGSSAGDIVASGPLTRFGGGVLLDGRQVELLSPTVEVTSNTVIESFNSLTMGDNTHWDVRAPCQVISHRVKGEGSSASPVRGSTTITAPGYLEIIAPDPFTNQQTIFEVPLDLYGSIGVPLLRAERFRIEGPLSMTGHVEIDSTVVLNCPITIEAYNTVLYLYGGTTEDPNIIEPGTSILQPLFLQSSSIQSLGVTRVRSGASLSSYSWVTGVPSIGELILEPGAYGGEALVNAGTLRMGYPGEPLGTANADSFIQQATGSLHIRVGSTDADGITGQPTTSTSARLSGELVVTLEEGHEPVNGEEHTIVSFDTRSGEFDTITGPPNMEVIYDPGGVRIRFNDPACNAADLAEPLGTLNIDDVLSFLDAFATGGAAADVAPPVGTLNIDDVLAFLDAFAGGCP